MAQVACMVEGYISELGSILAVVALVPSYHVE